MITINNTSRELNKKEIYKMTLAPSIQKLSLAKGSIIAVDCFCTYSDEKLDSKTGEMKTVEILSIMDKDGTVYATNSASFNKDFSNICDIMEGEPFEIEVISGISKAGREYITCTLV